MVLKTDKSGRLVVMKKDRYLQMGLAANGTDRKVNRKEIKEIEKNINNHTRMLCKVMNIGENNNHLSRVLESKLTEAEISAPKYYMYKDHKKKEAYRPVVSGCNSNTQGLSNLLSEMVEAVAGSVEDPYEVISSADLLARVEDFNKKIEYMQKEKGPEWDWRQEYMLIGSDVTSLFPSLSARRTAKIVRKQFMKSKVEWQNVDTDWLRLYVHLNRGLSSDVSNVSHLLPKKKKGRRGKESGMGSLECKKRRIRKDHPDSCWEWPKHEVTKENIRELLAIAMEISIRFFFENFIYTFGGNSYVQGFGGPIGARLTMCIARLVLQEWSEEFESILKESKIEELLRGIYVDDGRSVVSKIMQNKRFNIEKKIMEENDE